MTTQSSTLQKKWEINSLYYKTLPVNDLSLCSNQKVKSAQVRLGNNYIWFYLIDVLKWVRVQFHEKQKPVTPKVAVLNLQEWFSCPWDLKVCLLPIQVTVRKDAMLLFSASAQKLFLPNQKWCWSVKDGFALTYYFHTKLQLKRNLLKFLSRPLVHSRKSCCGSPPPVSLCLQLECSFRTQECL